MALQIWHHPQASTWERAQASTYITAWAFGHAAAIVGGGVLAGEALVAGESLLTLLAQWGMAHVSAGTTMGTALTTAATVGMAAGAADDVALVALSMTGTDQERHDAYEAYQLGAVDGNLPFGDVAACATMIFGGRLRFKNPGAFIEVYHGTSHAGANSIRQNGIDITFTRPDTDFGQGFYTTTDRKQAEDWVRQRYGTGEVLTFRIPVAELHTLRTYSFRGASANWQDFVRSNRLGKGIPKQFLNFDAIEGRMLFKVKNFLAGAPPDARGHQITWYSDKALNILMRGLVR